MGDFDWGEVARGRFTIGPMRISHDNGDTWHAAEADCVVCTSQRGKAPDGPVMTVMSVDQKTGSITVTSRRRDQTASPPHRPR